MKIFVVLGTRPEVIKMAPVIKMLESELIFQPIVCVSSQHRDMQDSMLSLFNIEPDYCLDVMKHGQDLFYITTTILDRIKPVLVKEKPDMVLVQGDTTTAFCGALAAFYLNISVGHVEAGLRTFDLKAPFPEEGNRAMIAKICSLHFAPTETAKSNLLKEMIPDNNIFVTGNTGIDALFWMNRHLDNKKALAELPGKPREILISQKPFILVTGHRRESFGQGFEEICKGISLLAQKYKDLHFLYPIHLNPNVRESVFKQLKGLRNVHLFEPVSYSTLVYLLGRCYLVLTDSGGIQEEAPALGKPTLVMRSKTERPEGINAGTARLVGVNSESILYNVAALIEDKGQYLQMAKAANPYGDGQAAVKICRYLRDFLG